MARMSITFDGFEDLAYRISEMERDLKEPVEKALTETERYVQGNVSKAAAKYTKGGTEYSTGRMLSAVKKPSGVDWAGSVASVGVGFDIYAAGGGGFHSIWMMYGTPRIKKDVKLYNAIRGAKTQQEIARLQEEAMSEFLQL